jgi:pimeloyl-ACP methyl ester carboxylesterase
MSDTYVLVHGAWHTGQELEAVAKHLRARGHTVHCPTLAGNNAGDDRSNTTLSDAIASLETYLRSNKLTQVRLAGHSYGGMVITGLAARAPELVKRLVYINAFVPNSGECMNDLAPAHYVGMFDAIASANNGAVMLPFEVWREAFINDADFALAQSSYQALNPHAYKTFTEPLKFDAPIAAWPIAKSYVNCQQDIAMPHGHPWHPRMSERLGLFRLVECAGSHEMWFSNPPVLADAIERAGRD